MKPSNSFASKRRTKHPELLPRPDVPLSPHPQTQRWYKVIRGRRVYFGPLDDPDAALERYLDQKDDLYAGRQPRAGGEGVVLRNVVNGYPTVSSDAQGQFRFQSVKPGGYVLTVEAKGYAPPASTR